jgi:TRAP-type C4-dicarboxylate transport system substrate-binding protein
MESNTQQVTTATTTANHDGQAPNVTFDDPVLSGLTPEQREAVEKLIKEKSTQLFEQQMKQ